MTTANFRVIRLTLSRIYNSDAIALIITHYPYQIRTKLWRVAFVRCCYINNMADVDIEFPASNANGQSLNLQNNIYANSRHARYNQMQILALRE